jgi:Lon protease-like protein
MTIFEKEIPLFPLGAVVLFPDMPLNLRIFEERYKQLVSDVLESEPVFGIVLIKEGKEVGQTAEPRSIGTLARIIEATPLENGNFYLSMLGLERFEIIEVVRSVPYLMAKVRILEDSTPDVPNEIVVAAQNSFSDYVRAVTAAQGGWIREVSQEHDPVKLSYLISTTLRAEPVVKQHLLEVPSVVDRLVMGTSLLQQGETRLKARVLESGPATRFSKN